MKNGGILRKIVSLVISSILICSIPVFASNVQSNANRQENRLVSTIGQTDDVVATTYEAATTNAKLNSLKNSFGSIQENIDYLIQNCSSKLTVWVNSHDEYYNGKTITLTKDGVTVRKCQMYSHNGRYEAEFPKLADGAYQVDYSFKTGNGGILHLKTNVTISGQDVLRQLYGDLFQMSMSEIQQACKDGTIHEFAHVGDTFSDGTYTYTIIGINQDQPSDANGTALNKSQYGDVLTIMPLGAPKGATNGQPVTMNASATPFGVSYAQMNSSSTNSGSWASSQMRSTTMPQYLAKLPQATQNAIGYVQKVTGTYNGNESGGSNSVTGDKCFLLSGKEIFGGSGANNGSWCTTNEANATFQYQYFQSIATTPASRTINSSDSQWWWLRSPGYNDDSRIFCIVYAGSSSSIGAGNLGDVFAAFCIY